MNSLDQFAAETIAGLESEGLRRQLTSTQRVGPGIVMRDGRRLVSFSCNDYLNLSHHPLVKQAAIEAIERYGTGAGASRLITGNHPLLTELEQALAKYKGSEDAIVFGSGYLANIGILPALVDDKDLVLADRLVHACMIDAAKLSGATMIRFRHNDSAHLVELLDQQRGKYRRCLILTETIFSMDGDRAPISELNELANANDAWLLTDDAHGLGLLERSLPQAPLQMGTLSKTLGSYGGYLCASRAVCDLMRNRARSFVFSTGLPPAATAAALQSLQIIQADPEWAQSPIAKARLFARELNLHEPASAIVPVIVGEPDKAMAASVKLEQAGFLAMAIRPPTVPPGTSRLRFTFSPAHEDADILAAASCLKESL